MGGDLRSIGNVQEVITAIQNQEDFDQLFNLLFYKDRIVVMRAADAIEKITISNPGYLQNHYKQVINLCAMAQHKELLWHLALLLPRLPLEGNTFNTVWLILRQWVFDQHNSRIVRVNAIQGLFELTKLQGKNAKDFKFILQELEKENIPSINSRIRKIKKSLDEDPK